MILQLFIFLQVYGCQGGLQMEANSHRKDWISSSGLKKLELLLIQAIILI